MLWLSSRAALPLWRSGSLPWNPDLAAAADRLRAAAGGASLEDLTAALDAECRSRLTAFAAGVRAYRAHPGRRDLADPPVVWREGTTRVLRYGPDEAVADAPTVLVVPSLINRARILDLTAQLSLMRHLAGQGIRAYLVDWDAPGEAERAFTMADYIAGRLERVLTAVTGLAGGPVQILGYCMGGLLALALADRRPADTAGLVLMATPWDFGATDSAKIRMIQAAAPQISSLVDMLGELPVDVLQAMFASLDPFLTLRKFRRFAAMDPESGPAAHFVALEDWLNDGVPLAGPVARECLLDWYGANAPGRGAWHVAGRAVDPRRVAARALVLVPGQDYIVPPASAAPLGGLLPAAETVTLPLGHIGMVASGRSRRMLYEPLAGWLRGGPWAP
ncbi:MAG: alpha/beta fold hydrolase [Hyphomicrobiales bacterium]|nr:alpha/beta fold hydrolase [Hyphomicrobiales bacterium]